MKRPITDREVAVYGMTFKSSLFLFMVFEYSLV